MRPTGDVQYRWLDCAEAVIPSNFMLAPSVQRMRSHVAVLRDLGPCEAPLRSGGRAPNVHGERQGETKDEFATLLREAA